MSASGTQVSRLMRKTRVFTAAEKRNDISGIGRVLSLSSLMMRSQTPRHSSSIVLRRLKLQALGSIPPRASRDDSHPNLSAREKRDAFASTIARKNDSSIPQRATCEKQRDAPRHDGGGETVCLSGSEGFRPGRSGHFQSKPEPAG